MTRGRHHNLACVVTEPAGDEHTPRLQPPTAQDVLAGALRRTRAEKSATETLRDELEQPVPEAGNGARAAIIEGLRQAQQHSYHKTVRRQAQRSRSRTTAPRRPSAVASPNCEPASVESWRHILAPPAIQTASAERSVCSPTGDWDLCRIGARAPSRFISLRASGPARPRWWPSSRGGQGVTPSDHVQARAGKPIGVPGNPAS